jgi:multicomponent Na+:H+ antiporter subunit D
MSGFTAHLPVLAVVVPLLTAPLVALLRDRTLAWIAAVAASLCMFALAITLVGALESVEHLSYPLGGWPAPYGIELRVDAFSALLLLIVTGASSAGLLIARESLVGEVGNERQHLYLTAWLLAVAGLAGIVVSGDAFNIFVFLEISSLATYVLIAGGPHRQALTAVFKYLIIGTIGATFYLIGIGLIYMMTGTLNLADMELRIGGVTELKPIFVAGGFITIGLALKAAIFPLHAWLPGAYTHAPHATTAFIAACSTKVALYVLLRFDFFIFQGNLPDHEAQFRAFVLPLAVVAMLVASAIAIYERRNLKRMLAYSSIAHVGYIVFGAALATQTGLTAAIVHMFNHALAKGTLFLAAACIGLGGVAVTFERLAGAGRRMPITMAAFVVGGLGLIGIPGTAGFVGKWYLVVGAAELGPAGVLMIVPVLVSSVLAVMYVWRAVEVAYFGTDGGTPSGARSVRAEAPPVMLAVLIVAAAANIWFGFQPNVPLTLAERAAEALLREPDHYK